MFSKKATKIDKIFTADLTLCSKCQIDGEDFVNFCGLLRKHWCQQQRKINKQAQFFEKFLDSESQKVCEDMLEDINATEASKAS